MAQWIPVDEWLKKHERDRGYLQGPDLNDYVPEWRRRLEHPELFPPLEELE